MAVKHARDTCRRHGFELPPLWQLRVALGYARPIKPVTERRPPGQRKAERIARLARLASELNAEG